MKTNNLTKNGLLLILSSCAVGLAIIVHILHRQFDFLSTYLSLNGIGNLSGGLTLLTNIFLATPILLLIGSFILFKINKFHPLISLTLTLTLVFSSIATIAGGDGLVEYHFSIFMVMAIIASFASIQLIIISLLIFAVHHLAGYFWFPQLLCGTDDYGFPLLMIHVVYLVFTSLATMLIIYINKISENRLEAAKTLHQQERTKLLAEIEQTSTIMVDHVRDLTIGSTNSAAASQEITSVLQENSHTTETQLTGLEEGVHNNRLIVEQVQQIHKSAQIVIDKAKLSLNETTTGQKAMQDVAIQMSIITETVGSIKNLVENLVEKSTEVGNLLQVITTISNQTKLLALNASIEAARAGEHGKGFSIVAEEVRSLAIGTEESASKIQTVVEDIQSQINKVASEMDTGMNEIHKGNERIQVGEQVFGSIHHTTTDVEKEITSVSRATVVLLEQSNLTNDLFKEITESAHHSFENLEGISAAAHQQTETTQSLERIITSLEDVAGKLNQLVAEANQA